jgi:hypothetical protein
MINYSRLIFEYRQMERLYSLYIYSLSVLHSRPLSDYLFILNPDLDQLLWLTVSLVEIYPFLNTPLRDTCHFFFIRVLMWYYCGM